MTGSFYSHIFLVCLPLLQRLEREQLVTSPILLEATVLSIKQEGQKVVEDICCFRLFSAVRGGCSEEAFFYRVILALFSRLSRGMLWQAPGPIPGTQQQPWVPDHSDSRGLLLPYLPDYGGGGDSPGATSEALF